MEGKSIKILQQNIRSIRQNNDQLTAYVQNENIDIVCLSETWLHNYNIQKFYKNYNVYQEDSKFNYARGVAIFVKKKIPSKKITMTLNFEKIEIVGVSINSENVEIYAIYLPEDKNNLIKSDIEKLNRLLQNKKCIVVGDFNAHHQQWGCTNTNKRGEMDSDLIDETNLMILNDGSRTKMNSINSTGISAIDLSLCSTNLYDKCSWEVTNETLGSDHYCILINYTSDNTKKNNTNKHKNSR